MIPLRSITLATALFALAPAARAEMNAQLNELLEQNAAAAAYAKMCDEEPIAEQLKSSTMLVLTTNDMASENIQLGSAKFNDVMRREIGQFKGSKRPDCPTKTQEARERLTFTQDILRKTRRDKP